MYICFRIRTIRRANEDTALGTTVLSRRHFWFFALSLHSIYPNPLAGVTYVYALPLSISIHPRHCYVTPTMHLTVSGTTSRQLQSTAGNKAKLKRTLVALCKPRVVLRHTNLACIRHTVSVVLTLWLYLQSLCGTEILHPLHLYQTCVFRHSS